MAHLTRDTLTVLLQLATTSPADTGARAHLLEKFVEALGRSGDAEDRDATLADAVEAIEIAASAPFTTEVARGAMAESAQQLGRACEVEGLPGAARSAYLLAERLVDPGDDQRRAVVWRDIADTWRAEGNVSQAEASMRTAIRYSDGTAGPLARATALASLAHAEDDDGAADRAARALTTALEVLGEAADSPGAETGVIAGQAESALQLARRLGRADIERRCAELAGRLGPATTPRKRARWVGW